MQGIQKYLQQIKGILGLIVLCGLFFSLPQWKIGYNFTADCPAAFRQQEEQIKEAIVKALQTWLQPLREWYPNRHFSYDK